MPRPYPSGNVRQRWLRSGVQVARALQAKEKHLKRLDSVGAAVDARLESIEARLKKLEEGADHGS